MKKSMKAKKTTKRDNSGSFEPKKPTQKMGGMKEDANKTLKISSDLEENKLKLGERLGVQESFDIVCREMNFGNKDFALFFVNGFTRSDVMTEILRELANVKREDLVPNVLKQLLETYVSHIQVEKISSLNKASDSVLSGQLVMLIDNEEEGLVIDVRSYPSRNPEEPDTERIVRGSRDGFTENLLTNTALTRRRIRDERLRMEILHVGERSKSDVCIAYLKDVADPGLVKIIKTKLQEIKIDGFPMAEKTLEEFVVGRNWHPFPLVRYTERPDVAAVHILEGHVLIYADTSPSVIITPTTFFHHLQHGEEYRHTPVIGTYLRWIRFIGIFMSIFLLPIWLVYVLEPDLLPKALDFIGPKDTSEIPIFYQFLVGELGLDLMRMAAIHTPTPLATAMGLIAAVLIGEIAIRVGWFVPEVILYLSLAVLGMYATPSYELSLANKLIRIFLLVFVYLFKIPGLAIGLTVTLIILANTKSLNTPYLWPFIPFNFKALMAIIFRKPVPFMDKRPSIVHPQNQKRQ